MEKQKRKSSCADKLGFGVKRSVKFSFLLIVFIFLTGCLSAPKFVSEDQLRSIRLKMGASVIAPKGYCLDRKLVEDRFNASFVIFLPCDDITGTLNPGLFTLTIAYTGERWSPLKTFDSARSIMPQNQFENKPQIHFRSIEVANEMRFSGMQNVVWQLIEQHRTHVKILTLHMPKFVKIDEIRAKARLFALMQQVQHPKDYTEAPKEPAYIMRPRIKPVIDYEKVFSAPTSYPVRPKIKPDAS